MQTVGHVHRDDVVYRYARELRKVEMEELSLAMRMVDFSW